MTRMRSLAAVTTACVAITLAFYKWFTDSISPAIAAAIGSDSWLNFFIGIFASIGFYLTLFRSLLWIYGKFIEDRINPKESIQGEWFYRLHIQATPNNPRYGLCQITKEGDKLSACGINFDHINKKFSSRFTSDYVLLDGTNLVIVYSSAGIDEEIFTRRGVYFLSTEGAPPKRIYGVWTDVLPSRNSGEIILQRRDKHTDNLLKNIGYPLDSSELQELLSMTSPFRTSLEAMPTISLDADAKGEDVSELQPPQSA